MPHLPRRWPAQIDPLTDLIAGVQRGEVEAYSALYRTTHSPLFQIANRVLRAPDHAEDIVQEVLLHAWQHADLFDPTRCSVMGWLSMLTRRRAIDRVRRRVRSVAGDHRHAALLDANPYDNVEETACQAAYDQQRVDHLRHALDQLTPRQREALTLTFLHGHTQQQAATIVDIPLNTMKTRVRDALTSLRTRMAPA